MRSLRETCFAALILTALPATTSGTSFVAVSDPDLVDGATLVLTGEVVATDRCQRGDAPCTDLRVEVDRLLKGTVDASPISVRLPGGVRADGLGLQVFGTPRLEAGDGVLLFLRPDPDTGWRILHLMLGAFRQVETDAGPAWARDLGEAAEVVVAPRAALSRSLRGREAFLSWIADRTAGIERPADYLLEGAVATAPARTAAEPRPTGSQSAGFTLFTSAGLNLRWFTFDSGGSELWRAHSSGQPGLTTQQMLDAITVATAAWSQPFSLIRYGLDTPATTTASGGLTTFDGTNAFLWENPNNNPAFGADFSCATGGVLAIGGPWFQNTPQQGYKPIISGDVITNRGIECYLLNSGDPQNRAEQLFAHELGHTLGIGHSCGDTASPSCGSSAVLNDAIMRANLHNDDRGARLNEDDSAACEALYGLPCIALVFSDGFESGDVTLWSAAVP